MASKHTLTKKEKSKGGKKSAERTNQIKQEKSELLKDASLKEVMIDVIKSPIKKRKICNDFLSGKFNAKSMQVLLGMLDGTEEKTSLQDFLDEQQN